MADKTKKGLIYSQNAVHSVSIVIPALNEADAIGSTIDEVRSVMNESKYDYEIIVVDDGSTDSTQKLAFDAGVSVVVNSTNMGYGNSILVGISLCNYQVIAIVDADGTYPLSLLPKLIEEANYYDMVISSRQWTRRNTTVLARLFKFLL